MGCLLSESSISADALLIKLSQLEADLILVSSALDRIDDRLRELHRPRSVKFDVVEAER